MSSSRDADEEADAAPAAKRAKLSSGADEDRKGALDPELAEALRNGSEAFVANDPESFDTLSEEQIVRAVAIARTNRKLVKLGLDGTGCPLPVQPAKDLGALAVRELKFVGLAFGSEAARSAFAEAAAANSGLEAIGIFETNADGSWTRFRPQSSAFAADVQSRRATLGLRALRIEQIDEDGSDREDGSEEEDGDEEEEAEGEEEEDDYVQCDGRFGKRRAATACGKRLTGDDAVFTNAFGQDYCGACHERLGREMRETTAAKRITEDVIPDAGSMSGSTQP